MFHHWESRGLWICDTREISVLHGGKIVTFRVFFNFFSYIDRTIPKITIAKSATIVKKKVAMVTKSLHHVKETTDGSRCQSTVICFVNVIIQIHVFRETAYMVMRFTFHDNYHAIYQRISMFVTPHRVIPKRQISCVAPNPLWIPVLIGGRVAMVTKDAV